MFVKVGEEYLNFKSYNFDTNHIIIIILFINNGNIN